MDYVADFEVACAELREMTWEKLDAMLFVSSVTRVRESSNKGDYDDTPPTG